MHGVRKKIRIPRKIAILCALALLIAAATGILVQRSKQQTIYTASYLKSIILKSDLSTRSAVYNGIAEVHNPKSPDKIDYYVSYKANVKTGINFEKLKVEVEDTDVVKTVYITLPPAYITGVEVDAGSLDYIFVNKKAAGRRCGAAARAHATAPDEIRATRRPGSAPAPLLWSLRSPSRAKKIKRKNYITFHAAQQPAPLQFASGGSKL